MSFFEQCDSEHACTFGRPANLRLQSHNRGRSVPHLDAANFIWHWQKLSLSLYRLRLSRTNCHKRLTFTTQLDYLLSSTAQITSCRFISLFSQVPFFECEKIGWMIFWFMTNLTGQVVPSKYPQIKKFWTSTIVKQNIDILIRTNNKQKRIMYLKKRNFIGPILL